MAKTEFKQGDAIIGKKWSGNPIIGIYEYTNPDGSHTVLDVESGRRFNIKIGDLKLASETESSMIKKAFEAKGFKLAGKPEKISFGSRKTKKEEEFDILLAGDDEDILD